MMEVFQKGGPLMWPILACSIVALGVILDRAFFWLRESSRRDRRLVEEILALAEREAYEEIREKVRGSKDFVIKVLVSGILHREFSLSAAMEVAAKEQLDRMRRGLAVLDTMVTVAPMLGILGTVTGIIKAFDLLGTSSFQDPRVVTVGIAEALITTAAGLIVAVPSVVAYNFFNKKADQAADEMETYGTSLEIVHRKNRHQATEPPTFQVPERLQGERMV
jgi:biopolymer transport protein ExbB